jgi:hypothetical protein
MTWPQTHIPIILFYKRGCQDKCLPHDGKAQGKWSSRPAPAMKRDAVNFAFRQIHRAVASFNIAVLPPYV